MPSAHEWLLNEAKGIKINIPWIDMCPPTERVHLAVHSDKIKEVFTSVDESLKNDKAGSIILLTGPSGSGKSSVIRILAKSNRNLINLLEWKDESVDLDQYSELESFIYNCSLFSKSVLKCDDIYDNNEAMGTIILLENLPAGVAQNPSRFQRLLQFHRKHARPNCLLVLILSSPISAQSNYFSDKVICPPTLRNELSIKHIEFNSVAASLIIKALQRIIKQLGIKSPSRDLLLSIANECSGDLRSAINQLQFQLCADINLRSSPLHSHRDGTLSIFHTVGKILYRKRLIDKQSIKTNGNHAIELPVHLRKWKKSPLSFDLEEVLELSHSHGDNMLTWLHENYVDFNFNLTALTWISDQLGWSDAYLTGGMNWRLGLTPAAIEDDSIVVQPNANASKSRKFVSSLHYPTLVVARTILLADAIECESDLAEQRKPPKSFRPLRPSSIFNVHRLIREKLELLTGCLSGQYSSCPLWLIVSIIKSRVVVILDYMPILWRIVDHSWFYQYGFNKDTFCGFAEPKHIRALDKMKFELIRTGAMDDTDCLCPADALAEGDALSIDENYSDEEM